MKTDELREAYLAFFESKGCVRKPSDLLVPANDPSVLFTPAGMNQFKEQFLGIGPVAFARATTCQKCIRTGDIENVGVTPRHMTFFEMLGNFSFGDYFKRDAIHWAWEFCTKTLKIAPGRLSVTVYKDDDEAADLWRNGIGIPAGRISRCGEDENFWPASAPSQGPDGVCGPCSEIYVDMPDGSSIEIWNLVFTQFNRKGPPPNNLTPLPKKNIDTGMGLERLAAVLQGVPTVHDIDIMAPIVRHAAELLSIKYDPAGDLPTAQRLRRIAEHARTVTMAMHENVRPGPAKQGYVVRRLLRRALVDAYRLGRKEPVLNELVPTIVKMFAQPYPELAGNAGTVAKAMAAEEAQFLRTVDRGLGLLDGLCKKGGTITGKDAFTLHAELGFPIDLTVELAAGRGVQVCRADFDDEFEHHQLTSGSLWSGDLFTVGPIQKLKDQGVKPTEFIGDSGGNGSGAVCGIVKSVKSNVKYLPSGKPAIWEEEPELVNSAAEGETITIILDRTSFYGESGGQVGDTGTITTAGFWFEVRDTRKTDGYFEHYGVVKQGTARVGMLVETRIDNKRRQGIRRAHSATHVLHAALHKVVGEHAKQAGSKVEEDVLRFDFSHNQAVTPDELKQIEEHAAQWVMAAAPIDATVMPIAEARKLGAMALFGEKYGDEVRVVTMGDFSREFCGGSHLDNTGKVGPLRIVREESVSAGVRRITAYTGPKARAWELEQQQLLHAAAAALRSPPTEVPQRIAALQAELKAAEKALAEFKKAAAGDVAATLLAAAIAVNGGKLVVARVDGATVDDLKALADELRSKASPAAILLTRVEAADKVTLFATVAKELQAALKAGDWIKETAALIDGKGGGRPDSAQGGGKSPAQLDAALDSARAFAAGKLA